VDLEVVESAAVESAEADLEVVDRVEADRAAVD
jgi:hypothetical protein